MVRSVASLLLWALLGLTGCDTAPKIIDPFPIRIDTDHGAVLLGSKTAQERNPLFLAVDVLSPITIMDLHDDPTVITRIRSLLEIYELRGDFPDTKRIQFPLATTYLLHPCPGTDPCKVGTSETQNIHGILGFDLLSRTSVRFNFADGIMRFFPDASGTTKERTEACEAVFERPFAGGGTLILEPPGREVKKSTIAAYAPLRPTVGACVYPSALDLNLGAVDDGVDSRIAYLTGNDMQFAISTAVGPTILTESAYTRLARDSNLPTVSDLPPPTPIYLPTGPVDARFSSVPHIALVAELGGSSNRRGPCLEVFANSLLRDGDVCLDGTRERDCVCDDVNNCRAAAAVEIAQEVPVAIVSDNVQFLRALRDELRLEVPELDGLLGTEALASLRIEFDYPNDRILMRCEDVSGCATRPQVRDYLKTRELTACEDAEKARRSDASPPQ